MGDVRERAALLTVCTLRPPLTLSHCTAQPHPPTAFTLSVSVSSSSVRVHMMAQTMAPALAPEKTRGNASRLCRAFTTPMWKVPREPPPLQRRGGG